RIVDPAEALARAASGSTIVFLDAFIGSGGQFVRTWLSKRADKPPYNFEDAYRNRPFVAAYVCLVATDYGLRRLAGGAPGVAVSATHVLDESSTVRGIKPAGGSPDGDLANRVIDLLKKYAPRLSPEEDYMAPERYRIFGYKERGLLFAFSHCVPDATLPIFWSRGLGGWLPLVERT